MINCNTFQNILYSYFKFKDVMINITDEGIKNLTNIYIHWIYAIITR